MSYPRRREPARPSSSSTCLLESVVPRIRPEDEKLAGWVKTYVANHRERIAFDIDLVRQRVPSGSRVLDTGAVPLLLTAALRDLDYEVFGVDLKPARFATTIKALGLEIRGCDIEREALPFKNDSFDAVVFNELFEHLRIDLIFTLSEVLRVLRPGGQLLLSTPNLRSLSGLLNFLVRGRGYALCGDVYDEFSKLRDLGHMGHVREYMPRDVITFLERIGFEIRELIYRGSYRPPPARWAVRFLASLRPFVTIVAAKPSSSNRISL